MTSTSVRRGGRAVDGRGARGDLLRGDRRRRGRLDEAFPRAEVPALAGRAGRRGQVRRRARRRFLGYPDGRVEATLDLRRDLARVIRQVAPTAWSCPSPERNYAGPGSAIPTTARSAPRPSTRFTRTPATPSPSPICATASPGRRTVREVWLSGSLDPTTSST